jgi:nucleoid DNA-binding protein
LSLSAFLSFFAIFASMENIDIHISTLLYHHECVIVPGLGGFVADPVPASFDEEKNMFFPPSKEIVFNANLKHNDGLLISHIANIKAVSYEEAGSLVNEFVADVTQKLKSGKRVSLDKVGELSAEHDGTVAFTPDSNENFNTDAFGLSSFHFNPHVPYQRKTYRLHPSVKRAARFKASHIAASVAIVAGLFFFSPEVKNPSIEQAGTFEFMIPVNNPVLTREAEKKAAVEQTAEKLTETPAAVTNTDFSEKRYFIIAGSFKREDQAETYCNNLRLKQGTEPAVIQSSNGRFRVAVNGFDDKADAIAALKSLRGHKEFKHAWILRHKK